MAEVTFEIKKHLAVLSTNAKTSWTKEVNIVSWNGGAAKLDVREWAPNHERMARGLTFSEEEARQLQAAIASAFGR